MTDQKLQKTLKDLKRVKGDYSKLRSEFDSKISALKRKHKLEVEGFKADVKLKAKEIERLKRECEKFKRKSGTKVDTSALHDVSRNEFAIRKKSKVEKKSKDV